MPFKADHIWCWEFTPLHLKVLYGSSIWPTIDDEQGPQRDLALTIQMTEKTALDPQDEDRAGSMKTSIQYAVFMVNYLRNTYNNYIVDSLNLTLIQ
jgi:hypothetical protein